MRCAWIRQRQITRTGAVLVRPDNVVGWRSSTLSAQPAMELRNALRQILGLPDDAQATADALGAKEALVPA